MLKRSFPPVVDERTRLLILGSLPGEQSLSAGRYYANRRNQFWLLLGAVIGRDLTALAYEERLQAVLHARVGLWDVIASATRAGSLDTAIRDAQANPLSELVATLPGLQAVAFNGAKSASVGRPALAEKGLDLVALPSSSPAYTLPLEAKRAAWMNLQAFL